MTLSDVAIRRPVFTAMMSLTLVVLGLLARGRIGTDLYPDVSLPFVTITTAYPGASPEDVEAAVTRPIEEAVSSIGGVDRVFSRSREDVSMVFVRFRLTVPIRDGLQSVRDKVALAVGALPAASRPPIVAQYDVASQPVLVFAAASGADPVTLRDLIEDKVRPRLEQVAGVAAVNVNGGGVPEIAVDLVADRLRALGLSPESVLERVRRQHLDVPAGRYEAGAEEIGIHVRGEFQGLDDLRAMPLTSAGDGSFVRLGDVARVRRAEKEARTLVRSSGVDAVAVEVVKQPGANSAQVANAAKALLPSLERELRFEAQLLVDQSQVIEANAREVWVAIWFGGAMAVLVILLFLLDVRGTLISAIALPTSVVGTLFVIHALGFTLNQFTLLGLSLAIGLLIDDSVVVRESISRRLERGEPPAIAASRGTQDIALAVLATTFTLVAVFVPVAFMPGITGQFFRQFGLTVAAAVLISLFVALTLDPMLSARFARAAGGERREGRFAGWLRAVFEAGERAYARSLDVVLRRRFVTIGAAAGLFVASVAVAGSLGSEFMPQEDRGQIIVNLEYLPGTSLSTSSTRSAALEAQVRALPGVVDVYATVGFAEDPRLVRWRVNLAVKGERDYGIEAYKQRIREALSTDQRLRTFAVSDPPIIEGLGDVAPIILHVTGPDLDRLASEAEWVAGVMRELPALADVQVSHVPGKPELEIDVDREAAARMGLAAGSVGHQTRIATVGDVAARLREGRREIDVRVRVDREDRASPDTLRRLQIATPRGPAELGQLATFRSGVGPAVVEHEGRERKISVRAQIAAGHDLGGAVRALHARLDVRELPAGYAYLWDGMQREQAESRAAMKAALGIAVLFIYIVLASQFDSLVHPLTIMLSLPLAVVGAILALAVTGRTINLGSLIGVILLMGLVTKNAILLVDAALQAMRTGVGAEEAVRSGAPRRLRPVLMTSAAMVLGMLPTALGSGVGSEFRSPMAIAVVGGILTSTLLTLWVVPPVFVWMERLRGGARPGVPAPQAPDIRPASFPPAAAAREAEA